MKVIAVVKLWHRNARALELEMKRKWNSNSGIIRHLRHEKKKWKCPVINALLNLVLHFQDRNKIIESFDSKFYSIFSAPKNRVVESAFGSLVRMSFSYVNGISILTVLKCVYKVKKNLYIYSVMNFLQYPMWDITKQVSKGKFLLWMVFITYLGEEKRDQYLIWLRNHLIS